MFDVLATVDGQRQQLRSLTLLGVHAVGRAEAAAGSADVLVDLEELPQVAREAWNTDASEALLARVVREAAASDILGVALGSASPFTGPIPSPLASVRPDGFGSFRAIQALLDELEPDGARLVVGELMSNGALDVSLQVDDEVFGSLVFASDALIVAVPPGATEVSVQYTPDDGFQREEHDEALDRVALRVDGEAQPMLLWRSYQGDNTLVVDGVSEPAREGRHRIALAALGTTVLVGRVVFAAHKLIPGERGDFTYKKRRRAAEHAEQEVAAACPDLSAQPDLRLDAAVVAVHGTMASAIPLAAALRPLADPTRVVRFEHDTWLPIADNARDLAARVSSLGTRHVLFVAHSRGGLVARHAMEILTESRAEPCMHLITLGTPFKGSPFIGPTGTALLGTRALLGMVRLASGAIVVDLATRLTGLLIRGRLPRGIAAMDPGSDYLAAFAHRAPSQTTTVAGAIDPSGAVEANALGFLRGVSGSAFAGDPNDLVVSERSARGACKNTLTVASDHFSYLTHEPVIERLPPLYPYDAARGLLRDVPVRRSPLAPPPADDETRT